MMQDLIAGLILTMPPLTSVVLLFYMIDHGKHKKQIAETKRIKCNRVCAIL